MSQFILVFSLTPSPIGLLKQQFSFIIKNYFYFMGFEWFACMYVHAWGARRGQERVSDPLVLELKMVVNHCVGFRNRIQVLCRSKQYLNHWIVSPVPISSNSWSLLRHYHRNDNEASFFALIYIFFKVHMLLSGDHLIHTTTTDWMQSCMWKSSVLLLSNMKEIRRNVTQCHSHLKI